MQLLCNSMLPANHARDSCDLKQVFCFADLRMADLGLAWLSFHVHLPAVRMFAADALDTWSDNTLGNHAGPAVAFTHINSRTSCCTVRTSP
jgi:hypothetical protein